MKRFLLTLMICTTAPLAAMENGGDFPFYKDPRAAIHPDQDVFMVVTQMAGALSSDLGELAQSVSEEIITSLMGGPKVRGLLAGFLSMPNRLTCTIWENEADAAAWAYKEGSPHRSLIERANGIEIKTSRSTKTYKEVPTEVPAALALLR